mmetsp:Transcript_21817/g.21106  ORF Transcript_21817/g.21106 Transcript_21817/m.21106 type:complete len:248 (-) Transcript_21817:368-1111(-)
MNCSVCNKEKACVSVIIKEIKKNLCLLHYSINDDFASKEAPKCSIIDNKEYLVQEISVKNLWKECSADVVVKMFEYEKEEQRKARISEIPIVPPRSSGTQLPMIPSFPADHITGIPPTPPEGDAAGLLTTSTAIPYSWKRGHLAEPSSSLDVPSVKKRGPTLSLWKTGAQKLSKGDIIKETERILENDRKEAQGEPCANCGSKLTFSQNLDNHDHSKNETWGSKDVNNLTARIECRECRHIWTKFTE